MKTGLSLVELAQKIEGNRQLKQDFIAPSNGIEMSVDADSKTSLILPARNGSFPINELAHDQIGTHLNIPAKYYDRMRAEQPTLLANNVNTWLRSQKKDDKRMIRTLGGDVRAFLSNRYNRIENEEIAEVVLPILADIPDVRIVSAEVTERRMYIQALSPRISGEVKKGDIVQAGVVISNSEVGHGAVTISPMVYRLVCLNGMISADGKLRANHVGGRIDETSMLYADDTRQADDRAILLKVRDHVKAAVDQVAFARRVAAMSELTAQQITGDVEAAVEVLAKKVGAAEFERSGILKSLIQGGDLSAWGMLNAVTHQAHTAANYDRSVEFEALGGQLLELPRTEWKRILEAA